MTAPRAAIVFNSSTGSDTAASGLGPATAVSGTAAAHTNGSASTTITLTNTPDLSGVQAGDLLWLNTGSGRQYSVIASVDNGADTVTVDDSFNIASGSAVDYAIGAKRATFDHADSRTLFADAKGGWTIETETDQSLTSTLTVSASGDTTSGDLVIRGSAEHKVITQTANAIAITVSGQNVRIENFKVTNSNGTKTSAHGISYSNATADAKQVLKNCILGDATNTLNVGTLRGGSGQSSLRMIDCEVLECTGDGVRNVHGSQGRMEFLGCDIHDNAGIGIKLEFGSNGRWQIHDTLIYANGSDGIRWMSDSNIGVPDIQRCVIHGNAGDGIQIDGVANANGAIIHSNQITANGGYGINYPTAGGLVVAFQDYNNFGTGATANTSGAINNGSLSSHDLQVDPGYADAANGDFSAGTNVKAKGFPDSTRTIGANQSGTTSYVDIGVQREEPAGGGGGTTVVGVIGE